MCLCLYGVVGKACGGGRVLGGEKRFVEVGVCLCAYGVEVEGQVNAGGVCLFHCIFLPGESKDLWRSECVCVCRASVVGEVHVRWGCLFFSTSIHTISNHIITTITNTTQSTINKIRWTAIAIPTSPRDFGTSFPGYELCRGWDRHAGLMPGMRVG